MLFAAEFTDEILVSFTDEQHLAYSGLLFAEKSQEKHYRSALYRH